MMWSLNRTTARNLNSDGASIQCKRHLLLRRESLGNILYIDLPNTQHDFWRFGLYFQISKAIESFSWWKWITCGLWVMLPLWFGPGFMPFYCFHLDQIERDLWISFCVDGKHTTGRKTICKMSYVDFTYHQPWIKSRPFCLLIYILAIFIMFLCYFFSLLPSLSMADSTSSKSSCDR